ncbi:2,4-dichlorophenol 6-monooxygenase, putative [Cordyceps militaris CM01]|uniref:2,4-dichlorophenol 6-monooxygenase, putative n=1 Tax=Cordyceps militaris (strain CM01) TaxID=983644 RepID=G3JFB6_CORMM|nr:2,4-dichlorophenol 6-monooxygenase, putative [Cordyceps militaris CM01]EGX92255.1 2,4-dichlorophenol 6-monooxygenase, putative [Cordyceps militaris CM01]
MGLEDRSAEYDVVIVGGGPVGLLMAYQLQRFGVTACVLEQHEKETQDAYGRAIALFPRTTEQLDQLGLVEPMLQLGFACRTSVTYKDGERVVPGRVWTFMENIKDTAYDFALVLRQMYTEEIFREKLESLGGSYYQTMQCIDFKIDESAPFNSYAVTSTFEDKRTAKTFQLKRYDWCNGGRSFVRRHADIPFEGDTSEDKWIRIDGMVETDMPLNRSYGAIESKTHGNILWAPLDHGATRIGYAYSAEIAAKYPNGVTQEVAEKEAIEAMKPFKVKFKEIHWWTLPRNDADVFRYTIGQRIAKSFTAKSNRVFLCGDAAHTHSSGAAQGLNTGIHDAVNLGWKLALQIRGLTQSCVLETYSPERMSAVQRLIDYDKDISTLMSYKWPAWYDGDKNADPYLLLGEIFNQAASFNTGLGISYAANVVNQTLTSEEKPKLTIIAGSRPPDVHLHTPGTNQKVRFQQITKNVGKFFVVVCLGNTAVTRPRLLDLRAAFADAASNPLRNHEAISWLTISPAVGCSPYEAIGMKPFGDMFYDPANEAHDKFGVEADEGAVLILRPDGLVGAVGPIDGVWIRGYFAGLLNLNLKEIGASQAASDSGISI